MKGGKVYLQHPKHGDHGLEHDDEEKEPHDILCRLLGVVLPVVDNAEDEAHDNRVQEFGLHLRCSSRCEEEGKEEKRKEEREGGREGST